MLLAGRWTRAAAGWPPRLRSLTFDARISSRNEEKHHVSQGFAAGPRVVAGSRVLRTPRFQLGSVGLRRYSTAVENANGLYEEVFVPTRSNGGVTLNIHYPHAVTAEDRSTAPIILYLPTDPIPGSQYHINDHEILSALAASSNGIIIQVNYRLGLDRATEGSDGVRIQYPTPIHDVLAAYDYVKERFAAETWTTRSGRVRRSKLRIGVCGQLIGGSLASMLALTESRLAEDRVAAVAVNCPIIDWIFPEIEDPFMLLDHGDLFGEDRNRFSDHDNLDQEKKERSKRKRRKKRPAITSWEAFSEESSLPTSVLLEARDTLFRTPDAYFDPFASPILFLRSPGKDVPLPANPPTSLGRTTESFDITEGILTPIPTKRRKAHRVFPPTGSSLILPSIRLSHGTANPLADSNEEFVTLLRRSIVRHVQQRRGVEMELDRFVEEGERMGDLEGLEVAVKAAEERVEYHVAEGVAGLWGSSKERGWEEEVWRVGGWFRKVLESG